MYDAGSRGRDGGMTLPEVLIAVTVMGLIIAVLSSAVVVTLRQNDGTEGRFNVARAEQTIGMWLPADLASAEQVDNSPELTACPGEATADAPCPGMSIGAGSNALLVTWATLYDDDADAGTRTYDYTYISYYYSQDTDGTYKLTRIECTKRLTGDDPTGPGWSCNAVPIVVGLPGPHAGWAPGDPVPEDVIAVTIPLDAAATDSSQVVVDGQNTKNARRVIVTVHGGGSSDGAGGGRNTISITAGGTYRTEIDAASMQGAPTFVEARSKCGGPLTLVIDESNSIPDINKVRDGVREFVKVLAGTPVRLQIVTFSDYARVLGTTTEWHRYFDLTNAAHVQELIGPPPHNSGGLVQQISYGGGGQSGVSSGSRTNWEDALYRSFRTSDGLVPQTIPKTLIFFTDGIPSRSRFSVTSDGRPYRSSLDTQNPLLPVTPPGWGDGFIPDPVPTNDYSHPYYTFNQVGFNRANYWANQARGSVQRMVGVFVGSALDDTSAWISNPGGGYHLTWERGSRTYQKASSYTLRARYWTRANGSTNTWSAVTKSQFDAVSQSNRKRDQGTNTSNWVNPYNSNAPSTSQFNNGNTTADTSDGFARVSLGNWQWVSTAEYESGMTTINADLYRERPTEVSNGPDWEPWTGPVPSNPDNTYRSVKVYGGTAPFDGYDEPASNEQKRNVDILGELIAPGGAVLAQWAGGGWVDEEADIYATTDWNRLGPALKSIALGECGGTLTLQTRRGGSAVSDPFVYQNSAQWDASGNSLAITPTTVTTNRQFTTGTFDLAIDSGLHRVVEIVPHNMTNLGAYSHVGWSCMAGVRPLNQGPLSNPSNAFEVFSAGESGWTGIRVKVGANEAVSCTQNVTSG